MAERIQLRRRLREQRRAREAMLLDLGALVYELHRHGRRAPELLQQRAAELELVDGEVRELEDVLAGLAPAGDHPEDAEDYPAGVAGEHGSYEEELAEDELDQEEPPGFDEAELDEDQPLEAELDEDDPEDFDEDDGLEDDGREDGSLESHGPEDDGLEDDGPEDGSLDDEELEDDELDGDATADDEHMDGGATLDDEHLDDDATVEVDALDGAGEGEGRP